jgi:putative DNA primase/helicase
MKHDIHALKRRLPLADLIGSVVPLKKHGKELKGLCPFHKEKTPSFGVFHRDGRDGYFCNGCGAGGDHIQFLQDYYQIEFNEALDKFAAMAGGELAPANDNAKQRKGKAKSQPVLEWVPAIAPAGEPAPTSLYVNREGNWVETPVVSAWPYCDLEGNLHGYTCRVEFDKADGTRGKDVIPVCWKTNTNTGEQRWKQGALPEPRLLYGAELLQANPTANIVLAEGEKATDAARRLLAGLPLLVLTWPGGCKAVDKADWSMLAGRKIVGWPDCDSQAYADNHPQAGELKPYHEQPGMAAMLKIAELVGQHGAAMRIVAVPGPGGAWPNGYDLADLEADGWTGEQVMEYLKQQLRSPGEILPQPEPVPANDNEPPPYDEAPPYDESQAYRDEETPPPEYNDQPGMPFRLLGVNRGYCYYLPNDVSQILELSASAHTKLNMLLLAPLNWWEFQFPSGKKSGDVVDWSLAANALIQQSKRVGVFRDEHIRGRGAWWDNGRAAVHVGDSVWIDGTSHNLINIPTRYIYESRPAWNVNTKDPLPTSEAVKLDHICSMPTWEKPISGKLLAGWCLIAPICGALSYRPSIWITGKSGSGKSTVMELIIWRMVESVCLYAASSTSEAGVRQGLEADAIPVVFDEIESEGKKQSEQVQEIMKLLTLSATDNGAAIYKGSSNGRAQAFRIRSMFAFASIGVNISQHAARTRVSVLSLTPDPDKARGVENFNRMLEMIDETMTPEWVSRMHARAISMIPVIRHNARVFAEAGAIVLGMRRLGDQIGTLLAGAYALYSSNKITPESARKWLEEQDWAEERAIQDQNDEQMCLAHIFGHVCTVSGNMGPRQRSIGEMVNFLAGLERDYDVTRKEAEETLRRLGIIVSERTIQVANSHRGLERVLAGTQWEKSWSRTLARIEGAVKVDKTVSFGGVKSKFVTVPIE